MKKMLCLFLSLSIFCGFMATAYASGCVTHDSVEYLQDGSYFITTVMENSEIVVPLSITCSGSKTTAYYSKSGSKLWSVTVTGTFTYGSGSRAVCTKSTVSANVYSSSWKITHSSASKSGNSASATATGTLYSDSAPINSITKTVTLTCSANGNLS